MNTIQALIYISGFITTLVGLIYYETQVTCEDLTLGSSIGLLFLSFFSWMSFLFLGIGLLLIHNKTVLIKAKRKD